MLGIGIIGLPNVGKSTLFNALLKKQQALAANYPFATIEPNVGVVPVPDARLTKLAEITREEIASSSTPRNDDTKLPPIKNALIEFVDIAGLVKGASEGAGLGNKFLSHIREVKVVAHVVRAFEDPSVGSGQAQEVIVREGSIDPRTDYETIVTELILSDLQTIENSKGKMQKSKVQVKGQSELLEKIDKTLNNGIAVRTLSFTPEEQLFVNQLSLLSAKPEVVVLNVSEDMYSDAKNLETIKKYSHLLAVSSESLVVICAKVESELAELGEEDAKAYLAELGVEKSGLERLIQKAYEKLGLISFLTCGEVEVKAWTIKKGSNAVEASGAIHTDFMQKFIKAEIVSYNDFIGGPASPDSASLGGPASPDSASLGGPASPDSASLGGWKGARNTGKARMEGRDYIMQDGDVTEFKIGR